MTIANFESNFRQLLDLLPRCVVLHQVSSFVLPLLGQRFNVSSVFLLTMIFYMHLYAVHAGCLSYDPASIAQQQLNQFLEKDSYYRKEDEPGHVLHPGTNCIDWEVLQVF